MELEIFYIVGVILAVLVYGILKPFIEKKYAYLYSRAVLKYGKGNADKIVGIVKVLVDNGLELFEEFEDEVIKSALENHNLKGKVTVDDVKKMKEGYKKGKKIIK